MFSEFWEKKKHLIQILGILSGVGAIFLSITPPENQAAREALANIQFIWLLIISISIVILFINFIRLSNYWEKDFTHRKGLDLTDTISLFMTITLIYLVGNLWKYVIDLYKTSLIDFLTDTSWVVISFIGAVIIFLLQKFIPKIQSSYKKVLLILFANAFLSISIGIWISFFIKNKLNFKFMTITSIIFFILISSFIFISEVIRIKRSV